MGGRATPSGAGTWAFRLRRGCCYNYDYANDDRGLVTYWLSHGRLRVVLVFSQWYVVLLSSSSSGASTLATILGTESGRGLVIFKGMPDACVRHLGLLGTLRIYSSLTLIIFQV